MKIISKKRREIFKIINIFSALVLVINMSFLGVFFVVEDVGAVGESCSVDADCVDGEYCNDYFLCTLCTGDVDNDDICDDVDNCPNTANSNQTDSDYDGVGDVCDNCPDTLNPSQDDDDSDGYGNVCDCSPNSPGMQERKCCFIDEDNDYYIKWYAYQGMDGIFRGEFCYCTDGNVYELCSGLTEQYVQGEDCDDTNSELTDNCEVPTTCGDGTVEWPNDDGVYEACDEGTNNGQSGSSCDYDCTLISTQTCDEGEVVAIEGYVDYVNIGDATSEAGLTLTDWSDWSNTQEDLPYDGNNYGGGPDDETFRLLMGPVDGCGTEYEEAIINFDIGDSFADEITFEHLDGSVDDSFDVYINDLKVGHYTGTEDQSEDWIINTYKFNPVTGAIEVKFVATEPDNSWCAVWGQVAFSWVELDGYGCTYCGDGECNSDETCSTCYDDCGSCGGGGTDPYCGDGKINLSYEECDDGNKVSGDGCSDSCRIEEGGGGEDPYCGDGNVDDGEDCDDGNNINGDGCSENCITETGGSSRTVVLGEESAPILSVTKTIAKEYANPGDKEILYKVQITNSGNIAAFDVNLVDVLPEGLTFTDISMNTREWELGDINPGDTMETTYKVDVDKDIVPGDYVNTVTVTASNHDAVNATASLEIRGVSVLAATGFSLHELFAVISLMLSVLASAIWMRRYA